MARCNNCLIAATSALLNQPISADNSAAITIPVATALIGHNRFHAGLEAIRLEIKCVELLVRILLVSIGMTPAELEHYMKMARPLLLELTWHNQTASVAARKAAQRRTQDLMRARRELSSRHDMEIDDAEVKDSKSGTSLKVTRYFWPLSSFSPME